jgi:hypothetical protein
VHNSNNGYSRFNVNDETAIGLSNAAAPITRRMLVMLEPSALPTDVSNLPCQAALAETNISGADEPIATMVRPIIIGDIPAVRAIEAAPKTKRSALQINRIKPTKTKIIANSKGDKIISPESKG